LEVFLVMMRRLIPDVLPHRLDVHRADAELAVSALPPKIGVARMERLQPNVPRTMFDSYNAGKICRIDHPALQAGLSSQAHGISFMVQTSVN
jgi:hypothetical protein